MAGLKPDVSLQCPLQPVVYAFPHQSFLWMLRPAAG